MTMTEEKVAVCTVTRFNWDDMEVAKECGRVIEISDGCILWVKIRDKGQRPMFLYK